VKREKRRDKRSQHFPKLLWGAGAVGTGWSQNKRNQQAFIATLGKLAS
jgi:hypothetical protein